MGGLAIIQGKARIMRSASAKENEGNFEGNANKLI